MNTNFWIRLGLVSLFGQSLRAELNVYGPGGPAPAMKACAAAFEADSKTKVNIIAGPMENWIENAPTADLFFSGSENMMDSFADRIPFFDASTITTRYLRPSAILVRPGNPKKISGVKDLVRKKLKVIVVNGAGQTGMWEDIIGGLQSVEALNKFRANIAFMGRNTGEAERQWNEDPSIDAWLVFNIWGKRNPDNSQIVKTDKKLTIYRSMGTALSSKSPQRAQALKFAEFISSPRCKKIFENAGWSGASPKL